MGKRRHSKPGNKSKTASAPKQIFKRRQHSQTQISPNISRVQSIQKTQHQALNTPFTDHDNVLLVGEGDFSFAVSLKDNYHPAQIVASCFDSEDGLSRKYPNIQETLQKLMLQDFDSNGKLDDDNNEEWQGLSPVQQSPTSEDESAASRGEDRVSVKCKLLYGIDATKLSTGHRKKLKASSPFSKIVFNFPHIGGLSTDVNRQVRANQELLAGFFNAAKPLLTNKQSPSDKKSVESHGESTAEHPAGQILVTLFEGEPYTLWNIRDLARHCGLQVVKSFKFPWEAYPGYQHARTIGEITTGKDRSAEGKRKGVWRGEERAARCYVLERKEDDTLSKTTNGSKKRKRNEKDSDADSD